MNDVPLLRSNAARVTVSSFDLFASEVDGGRTKRIPLLVRLSGERSLNGSRHPQVNPQALPDAEENYVVWAPLVLRTRAR